MATISIGEHEAPWADTGGTVLRWVVPVILLGFLAGGVLVLSTSVPAAWHRRSVTARIVAVHHVTVPGTADREPSELCPVTVRYTVGQQSYTREVGGRSAAFCGRQPGDSLRVLYDTRDPGTAATIDPSGVLLGVVFCGLALTMLGFLGRGGQRRRHDERSTPVQSRPSATLTELGPPPPA